MQESRLRTLRKQRGLTLADCGNALYMTRQGYARIEKGNVRLKLDDAKKLSELFGVSLDEIVEVTA